MGSERMTTWQMEDGSPINDVHWVTELEFFEGDIDPSRLIRKVWVAESAEAGTYYPPDFTWWCTECDGEGDVLVAEEFVPCVPCGGSGAVSGALGWHPDATPHDAATEHLSPEESPALLRAELKACRVEIARLRRELALTQTQLADARGNR